MHKPFIFLLPFIFIITSTNGQSNTLYLDASDLQIESQAILQVNGDMTIGNFSDFKNEGLLYIQGNLVNNASSGFYTGLFSFTGTSPQSIDGSNTLFAGDVLFNNPSGITLNQSLRVNGTCSFVSGIVDAGTRPLVFGASGSVSSTSPASDSSHVNGEVVKLGTGTFTYPVGDGTRYQKASTDLSVNDEGMHVTYLPTDAGVAPFTNAGSDTSLLVWYNPTEHWLIRPEAFATGTVTLYWDGYRDSVKGGIIDQRVAHQDGDWLNEGTNGTGSFLAGSVTSNILSSWSPFTLGSISFASPLPIELLSFGGKAFEGCNLINWTTGVERANSTYELERSNDARQYTKITSVAAKGNSNNSYQYKDDYVWQGNVFYRLKIVEQGKPSVYSNTLKLLAKGKNPTESVLYPNPANQYINLSVGSTSLLGTTMRLSDVSGKFLQELLLETMIQKIDLSHYTAGDYILSLDNGETFKLTKAQ